jgi:hypothetical protein
MLGDRPATGKKSSPISGWPVLTVRFQLSEQFEAA